MEKEKHDEWYTTKKLYDELCTRYVIYPKLDVSAAKDHHMCNRYFTKEDDALTKQWVSDFWMNPPLLGGKTKKFTLYAREQWNKWNVNGLCIIPAGVISRQWFRPIWDEFMIDKNPFIDPIKRPTFLEYGNEVDNQARNDYIALVFRKR
jgi:hypothetical protein